MVPCFGSDWCKVLLVVALATTVTSRQYQVRDDEDSSDGKEYSDYYGGESQASDQEDAKAAAGFVEPIDFSALFASGFGSSPSSSSKIDNFFKPQGGAVNPFSLGLGGGSAFPSDVQASASTNNGTGFISPAVRFQSFFDLNSAGTEGFRPQDFIKRASNDHEDGVASGTSPVDFFSPSFGNINDDFTSGSEFGSSDFNEGDSSDFSPSAQPTKVYPSSGKYSGKPAPGGKSSYPAPTSYPSKYSSPSPSPSPYSYGSNPTSKPQSTYSPSSAYQTKPTSGSFYDAYPSKTVSSFTPTKPSGVLPYDAYPAKSTSTYNPTGPYLSKPGYKSSAAGSNPGQYRAFPAPSYESKSVYPKKATEFYPSKVGQRPSGSSFRPTAAQTQDSPRYQYSSGVPQEGKSRYVAPQDYYKFGPNLKEAESRAEFSLPTALYAPFSSRASDDDDGLPPTANPYAPREYGKDAEFHTVVPEAAENDEIKINPAEDKKNCRKIEKTLSPDQIKGGRFRRDAMTCYVCNDPKTGGNFERCSYDSAPDAQSQNYFHGHATTFSSDKIKPKTIRQKRDLSDFAFDNSYSDADYDSLYTFSEPHVRIARQNSDSYEKNYGGNPNYEEYISKFASPSQKNYQYKPEHYTPHEYTIVDDAEHKTAPSNNADQHCKTITKGTMTCSICHNPKTGGNSEQCSYATNPKENNYFVARQSSFNTKNPNQGAASQRSSRQEPKTANHGVNDQPTETYSTRTSIKPYDFSTEVSAVVTNKGSYKGPLEVSPYQYGNRRSDDVSPSQQFHQDRQDSPSNQQNNYGSSESPSTQRNNQGGSSGPSTKQHSYNGNGGSSTKQYDGPTTKQYSYGGGDGSKSYDYSQPSHKYADRRSDESKHEPQSYFGPSKSYEEYFKELFPEIAGQENKHTKRNDQYNPDEYKDSSQAQYVQKPTSEAGVTVDPVAYYRSVPDYYPEPKKDLEKVLGEFSQKDRTSCKKVIRDKMTCYQCVDKKGMQHEECMFVAASEPKSQHLAYHEVKEFRLVPDSTASPSKSSNTTTALDSVSAPSTGTKKTAASKTTLSTTSTTTVTTTTSKPKTDQTKQRKILLRRATPTKATTSTTTTTTTTTQVTPVKPSGKPLRRTSRFAIRTTRTVEIPATKKKQRRRRAKAVVADAATSASEQRESRAQPEEEEEEEDDTPVASKQGQFDVDREGYYTEETKQVYDPVQKVYLPEYMLTKSSHEEIFDEVMKSGR